MANQWLGIPLEKIGTVTASASNVDLPISFSAINYTINVTASGSASENLTVLSTARISASAFRVSQAHKGQYGPGAIVIGW